MIARAAALAVAVAALGLLPIAASAQKPTRPGWPRAMNNNPLLGYAALNQNEWRTGDGTNTYRWEGEGWFGGNLNRAWLKTEGDLNTDSGALDEAEVQLLYSRAISSYFNLQAGARYDFDPTPSRAWATFGVEGLAPLFFHVGAFAFISSGGHCAARLEGHYDLLLTQRLVLEPQAELNFYTKSEASRGIGSGLSDLDSGLRLRYEVTRQFAPYIGFTYERKFGGTADFARRHGEGVEDARLVVGIRAWY